MLKRVYIYVCTKKEKKRKENNLLFKLLYNDYCKYIGYELFSTINFRSNDAIAEYPREITTTKQAQRRIQLNYSLCRYLNYLSKNHYLNCKASLANSPLHC